MFSYLCALEIFTMSLILFPLTHSLGCTSKHSLEIDTIKNIFAFIPLQL